MRNVHPVDELADVRAAIKSLETREAELRQKLLSGEASLCGDTWRAVIRSQSSERIDAKAARRALGDALRPFMRRHSTAIVRLEPAGLTPLAKEFMQNTR
jgi:hypothetical protein